MTPADESLRSLPLFPLQTALFPGGRLALRIFEVRYLDMIGRAWQTGQPFGVVCLSEGDEVQRPANGPGGDGFANEAFHAVGTLARIVELERPQPGLLAIRCIGGERFRLTHSEKQRFGLWVGDADRLPEDPPLPVPDDLALTRRALQTVRRQLEDATAQQGGDAADLPLQPPFHWDDCGWLANRWGELLPLEPGQKHRLMALDSPLLRLELVADLLTRMGIADTSD